MGRTVALLIIIFFLTILLVQNSSAQMRNIILKIDTVDYNGYQEFYIKTQREELRPYIIKSCFCTTDNFGLACKLTIQNDSSTISISIDKKGGYLEINNIYKLSSDTLRISKVFVFDRPFPDTNWTTTDFFFIQKDTLADHFKTTKKYKIDQISKKDSKPISTSYLINDKKYFCDAVWKPSNYKYLITKFHGYGKTGILKRRRPYSFHGSTRSTITHNVITIQLKH